jgi:putative ABC transport system ATP-binding protein
MMPNDSVIHISGVKKVYKMGSNQVFALRGVDLTVGAGEMIAVMGSSGSGKSTLMNILGCLDVPSEGSYVLDGTRVDGLSKNALADLRNQKLGFVFQGFNLLPRTSAIDNVELPLLYDRSGRKLDTRSLATESLRRVGLGDRLDHEPSELSGGQQQRVALGRALIHQPRLIVCDEPTSALDAKTGHAVMELLSEVAVRPGRAVIVVTHDSRVFEFADTIAHMDDGRIQEVEAGSGRARHIADTDGANALALQ